MFSKDSELHQRVGNEYILTFSLLVLAAAERPQHCALVIHFDSPTTELTLARRREEASRETFDLTLDHDTSTSSFATRHGMDIFMSLFLKIILVFPVI